MCRKTGFVRGKRKKFLKTNSKLFWGAFFWNSKQIGEKLFGKDTNF